MSILMGLAFFLSMVLWQLEIRSINRHMKRMIEMGDEIRTIEFQRGVMIGYGYAKHPEIKDFSEARDIIGNDFIVDEDSH